MEKELMNSRVTLPESCATENTQETIRPIKDDVVHKICSGQVVLSLAIAVKELVENAVDAGASIIDIKLKDYGAEYIEVSDNGSGIIKENFQVLTLKHYTSKLRTFNDLESIATLGFRGEALSSLCALANVSIITKHHSEEVGSKISYDYEGSIASVTPAPREQGTTVTLENLFYTLPVRRKDFLKNLKKEFSKMCQLLYAYCLVTKGIKFTCSNTTTKGSKNTVVATEGHHTVRENIINVFGTKVISSLIEVELKKPDESILSEYGITSLPDVNIPFNFEFLISSVMHGSGRSSTDRQFFFINHRPCEPTKAMKLINEIYKQYNSSQYPFIYLNILTNSALVDVNVTPDKRQVYLEKESYLLATIKFSLIEAFKAFPSSYKMQSSQNSELLKSAKTFNTPVIDRKGLKRNISQIILKTGSILETFKKRSKSDDVQIKEEPDSLLPFEGKENYQMPVDINKDNETWNTSGEEKSHITKYTRNVGISNTTENNEHVKADSISQNEDKLITQKKVIVDTPLKSLSKKRRMVKISFDIIRNAIKSNTKNKHSEIKIKFHSHITPENNKEAEEELMKQLLKEDFKKMDIIGQFNLGFIIAKLENDLFIIDQHASDEKYNFEKLQTTTVIENQKLMSPKILELTAGNECLLIENEHIFNKNGFAFKIDHTAPCTKKVALTAIPISKNFVFGKDDIEEMLFMLQESNNTSVCRPSRIRAMFASRACRKSVMIGTALSSNEMHRLVEHMADIEQPWNCPHGRPTMRHLINLGLIDR